MAKLLKNNYAIILRMKNKSSNCVLLPAWNSLTKDSLATGNLDDALMSQQVNIFSHIAKYDHDTVIREEINKNQPVDNFYSKLEECCTS